MTRKWRHLVAAVLLANSTLVAAQQTAFVPLFSYDREFRRSMGFHFESVSIGQRFRPTGLGLLDLDVSENTQEAMIWLTRELRKDYPSDVEHFFTQLELIFLREGEPSVHLVTRIHVHGGKAAFTYLSTKTPSTSGWPVSFLRNERRFSAANLIYETAVGLFREFTSPTRCALLPVLSASEAPSVLNFVEPQLRAGYLSNLAAAALELGSICESIQAAKPDALGVLLGRQSHVAVFGNEGPRGLLMSRLRVVDRGKVSVIFGPYVTFGLGN